MFTATFAGQCGAPSVIVDGVGRAVPSMDVNVAVEARFARITGFVLDPMAQSAFVIDGSVVRRIDDTVWAGFQDGSVRAYDEAGAKLLEFKVHAGAVTDIVKADGAVYSGSLDTKVVACSLRPGRGGRGSCAISRGSRPRG